MNRRDEVEYEASQIDWRRLHGFARRVAAAGTAHGKAQDEARNNDHGLGSPWKLDRRSYESRSNLPGGGTHSRETHTYWLHPDGRLTHDTEVLFEAWGNEGEGVETTTETRPFDESDVALFDYNRQVRTVSSETRTVRSDRDRGDRLPAARQGRRSIVDAQGPQGSF